MFAEGGYDISEKQFIPPIPASSPYEPMRKAIQANPRVSRKALMVRTREWKYVYCPEDTDELYDLTTDPDTTRNLVGHPEYETKRNELRERLLRWFLGTGDILPRVQDPRGWRS